MPLQTTFGQKVTDSTTTQIHPLGTLRFEGSLAYKYVKGGATIANKCVCGMSADGTVVLASATIAPCGLNNTGGSRASGDYFWMQVGGTVTALNTNSVTGAGYPLWYIVADGTITGATASGAALANSTVSVKSATLGIGELRGLL
jgi:hypothetical protein